MVIFKAGIEPAVQQYQADSHLHLKQAINPAFLAWCREFVADAMRQQQTLDGFTFANKKQQFLFEFPPGFDLDADLLDPIAQLTGLQRAGLTLCERHIKAYSDQAEACPAPHKDRLASEVAVAIPIEVPEDSRLMLYPDADRKINAYSSTADWLASLDESALPENVMHQHQPLLVDVRPGDIAMFPGSSVWHERLNPARTCILYLKLNSMGLDPLGEDPRTAPACSNSVWLEAHGSDAELQSQRVCVSPRLESLTVEHQRLDWTTIHQAHLYGRPPLSVSPAEFEMLKLMATPRPIAELTASAPAGPTAAMAVLRSLLRRELAILNWADRSAEPFDRQAAA